MLSGPHALRATVGMLCAALAPAGAHAGATTRDCFLHETQAGDTLIQLSERYLARPADWPRVARLNHVTEPRRMPVGLRLCLPVEWLQHSPRSGQVLEVVGHATLTPPRKPGRPADKPVALARGQAIEAGAVVQTEMDGYVTVQLADGSVLSIQADTQAGLERSDEYTAAGFFASVWTVLKGRVESVVQHLTGGEPRYQIKTPQAVLGVRGTEFRVQTGASQTTNETLKGRVAVRTRKGWTEVPAGQGLVASHQGASAPVALPAAPDLSQLPTRFERVLLRFDLPPQPGIKAHWLQVASDAAFRQVRGEVRGAQSPLRLTDLPDGTYHLRVRSVDAHGLESPDAVTQFVLKARPEAPIPTQPAAGAKVRGSTLPLAWTAHPDAVRYRVQVARDATFQDLVLTRDDLMDTHAEPSLPPGDYHWRLATTARAPDGSLDRGPWGDGQLVRLRALPPDAPPPRVSEDQLFFQLPAEPGQRFTLQVARDEAFQKALRTLESLEPNIAVARPAEGGTLYMRYRATDADGYVGPYTRPQRVDLPACVRDGAGDCVLGQGRFLNSRP